MRHRFRIGVAVGLAAISAVVVSESVNSYVAPGFEATVEIDGLDRPTNLEFAPDGRIFVAEQSGLLKVYDSLDDSTPTVSADLRDAVHAVDGRGLLGLALDPNFPDPPHVYVLYTFDAPIGGSAPTYGSPGATHDECPTPPGPGKCVASGRLSRLTLDGDVAVAEEVLIEAWCAEWTSHSIGDLAFGPDGSLYASAGDGAFAGQPDWGQRAGTNACDDPPVGVGELQTLPGAEGGALRSQDLRTPGDPATLNGSIIRVDKVTGDAVTTNPLAGDADANVRRVIGYGFRNPYRLTFRPGTSELFVADVGWNTWEEINRIVDPTDLPGNYGWPCYEGTERGYDIGATICEDLYALGPSAVVPPFYAYEQRVPIVDGDSCLNSNGSPSALEFYDGGAYPAQYDGALFFGDYSRRCLWAMLPDASGQPDPTNVVHLLDGEPIVDIETGPGGDLYLLSIFGGGRGGKIIRLQYPEGQITPIARITSDVTVGSAPLTVALDASSSTPGLPGDALAYAWDLDGDGAFDDADSTGVDVTFTDEGVHVVQVRVTDQRNAADVASLAISVGDPPVVHIDTPSAGLAWIVDQQIDFSGTIRSATGETLPPSAATWDLILHHCEALDDCHTHVIGTIEGVTEGSFLAPEHEYPSYIEITLTGTSTSGLRSEASIELFPATTTLTLETDPSGGDLTFNGIAGSIGSHDVIVGSTNSVGAASPQLVAGGLFDFESFAVNGEIVESGTPDDQGDGHDHHVHNHDVVVNEPTTIRASFVERAGTTSVGASEREPTVTAVPGPGVLDVSWQPVDAATKYQFRYRVLRRAWRIDPSTTETTRTVSGLQDGVEHTVAVRAYVDGRWSGWTTVTEVPGVPATDGGDPGGGDGDPGGGGGDPGGGGDGVTVVGSGVDEPTVTVVPTTGGFAASWTPVKNAKLYQMKYRLVGSSWQFGSPFADLSQSVSGLTVGGDYQIEVRAFVDSTWRGWTRVTVPIVGGDGGGGGGGGGGGDGGGGDGGGDASTELTVDVSPTINEFTATWNEPAGATMYQFRYRVMTRKWNWDPRTTETSRTVTGLSGNTEHTAKVRAQIDGRWSDWTTVVFTTL